MFTKHGKLGTCNKSMKLSKQSVIKIKLLHVGVRGLSSQGWVTVACNLITTSQMGDSVDGEDGAIM